MGSGFHGGFGHTSGEIGYQRGQSYENSSTDIALEDHDTELVTETLIQELRSRGVKFSEENVVMVTHQSDGQLLWLEKGNGSVGLQHIIQRHAADLKESFGVEKPDIPLFIKNVVEHARIVSNRIRNGGFERIYDYNGSYYVASGIGTNGFIITIYPMGKSEG